MKMTFKKYALLGLAIFSMFVLVGCTEDPTTLPTDTTQQTQTDQQKVQAVLDGISLEGITAVTADLTLPTTTVNGVSLSWSTANADIVSATGEITVPDFVTGDQTVVLTLTATLNQTTLTKTFNVTVKAETVTDFLNRVGLGITITNSDSIVSNFKLPGASQGVTITWTSDNSAVASISAAVGNDGFYTVTVTRPIIEEDGVDTSLVLSGVLTIGTNSITITRNIRVLAMNEINMLTIAEASAHPDAAIVTFSGVVTALIGSSAFVQDATGGIYIYNVDSALRTNIIIGNEISVTGEIDIYNSFVEVKAITAVELISTDNELPEAVEFTLVDLAALFEVQGQLASMPQLKLAEEVTTSISNSVVFTVTDGITEVEVKIDKYIDDIIQAEINAIIDGLEAGDTFKLVNALVAAYYGDGQFYITDPSQIVVLTDAEKLAADKAMLTIPTTGYSEGTFTLPVAGIGGSAIAWTASPDTATIDPITGVVEFPVLLVNTDFTFTATLTKGELTAETKTFTVNAIALSAEEKVAADLADIAVTLTAKELDKVTLPILGAKGSTIEWAVTSGNAVLNEAGNQLSYPFIEEAQTVVLTATVSQGEVQDEVTFTVEVAALELLTIAEYKALADNAVGAIKVTLTGNTASHQWWLHDATGSLNMYIGSSWRTEFSLITWGSEIVLVGPKNTNYGMPQMNNITTYFVTETVPTMPTPVNLDEVLFTNEVLLPLYGNLVSFSGFTVKTLPTADSYGTYTFTLEDVATTRTINVRLDNRVIPAALYDAAKAQLLTFTVGQKVDVVAAYMSSYSSSYELAISLASHIIAHVDTPVEIAAADAAALTINATYDANEVVTLPSTSNTSTIVWSVELAEVNASIVSNVVTFANVTETTVVTLTATLTYGTIETVKTFDVSIVILTPAEKLAADKAGIDVALAASELQEIILPTTTTYGSVVSWALTETTNALLTTNELSLEYLGSEYSVTVTATLTLGELSETKSFTIVVSPMTITEISSLKVKDATDWTIVNGTKVLVKATIAYKYYTSGFFLQDIDGNGIYVFGSTTSEVGDEVLIYATASQETYNATKTSKMVRTLSSYSIVQTFPEAKTITPFVLTAAELADSFATFYEVGGMLVTVTGIEVKSFSGDYVDLYWSKTDNSTLSFKFSSLYPWMTDVYEAGDLLPEFTFILRNMYDDSEMNIIPYGTFEMSETQKVDYDLTLITSPQVLFENYVLPTAKYNSIYQITNIPTELDGFINTDGEITIPDTDKTGTIQVTVTNGLASSVVDVVVTVKSVPDVDKVASAKAEIVAEYDNKNIIHNTTLDLWSTDSKYGTVITWASNNALVNATTGAVGTVTEPTAVILTATISMNLASDTVDVTINVVVTMPVLTAFASYTGTTTTNMAASPANNATIVNLEPTLFTVLSIKGAPSNNIGLNSAGQIRLYANKADGNGNTLEVSIGSGYTITEVSFVFGASSNSPTATLMLGTESNSLLTADLLNVTKTYSDLSIQSFSLQNTQNNPSATSNAQVYILSITISYIEN